MNKYGSNFLHISTLYHRLTMWMTGRDITWLDVTSHDWHPFLVCLVQTWNNRRSGQSKEFLRSQVFTRCCKFPSHVKCTPPTLDYGPSITGNNDCKIFSLLPNFHTTQQYNFHLQVNCIPWTASRTSNECVFKKTAYQIHAQIFWYLKHFITR